MAQLPKAQAQRRNRWHRRPRFAIALSDEPISTDDSVTIGANRSAQTRDRPQWSIHVDTAPAVNGHRNLRSRLRERRPWARRPSGLRARPRDLISEIASSLAARPLRTLLTAFGTVLGVGALVATLGLASTAGGQIVARFDELTATEVSVVPRDGPGRGRSSALPFNADQRLETLNGVVAASTISQIDVGGRLISSVPVNDPLAQNDFDLDVYAGSASLFRAVRAELAKGRFFDEGHDARADSVAVLGPGAADRLNINRTSISPSIFVGRADDGGTMLVVIGIISDVERRPELLNSVIVSNGFATRYLGLEAPAEILIDTEIGAAELVGRQAPLALAPNDASRLDARVPPSPRDLQQEVRADVNVLFVVLGLVSLVVGALGIANVTLVSVMERTTEIGLRRALGATQRDIAMQFLAESAALGALGGLLGASLGVIVVVSVSAARDWTPILDPWIPVAAPLVGLTIGLVAGAYPAMKAAQLEPITALRM